MLGHVGGHFNLVVFKFSQSVITQSRGSSAARPEDSDAETGRGRQRCGQELRIWSLSSGPLVDARGLVRIVFYDYCSCSRTIVCALILGPGIQIQPIHDNSESRLERSEARRL